MESLSTLIANIASKYTSNRIFILGKGPSVDSIDSRCLDSGVVIGINDADRIHRCDFSIFSEKWFLEYLTTEGCNSDYIFGPECFHSEIDGILGFPFLESTQHSAEQTFSALASDLNPNQFYIDQNLFVSGLILAKLFHSLLNKSFDVYMIGFDFDGSVGVSNSICNGRMYADISQLEYKLVAQKEIYKHSEFVLRGGPLNLMHVGSNDFSYLSPNELNTLLVGTELGSLSIKNRVEIVAEFTTNHFGDRDRLKKMVYKAKAAGADYVKVQKRDVESFYTQNQLDAAYKSPFGDTFREYRLAIELGVEDFLYLDKICKSVGIMWFASVLDQRSFEFIQQFSPQRIKLPSTISEHTDFLKIVGENFQGDVVISTGMTEGGYVNWILKNFIRAKKIYIMQCNSSYPTPLADCNIGVIRNYRDLANSNPQVVPGYSSHDLGDVASVVAVGAGARIIEKHVKLGATDWAHFDSVALDLTTTEFSDFVKSVREAELVYGDEQKKINASEHHKYLVSE